jgi:N4-gp56 family major capsid protein
VANAFNSTTSLTDVVETAFDRVAEYALRSMPQFRAVADKKPADQAMPGDVVVFTIHGDMSALATTPLTETVDPDAVARPAPTRVSVTLNEYGNAQIDTIRMRKLAFTNEMEAQGITIARNMADTMDRLVRTVMETSTNVLNQADGTIKTTAATDYNTTTMKLFQNGVSKLRGASVEPKEGEYYVAYVHPDVSFDLRTETGGQGWLAPHSYVDTAHVYAGEIGAFGGARFIETPRCPVLDTTEDVYTSFLVGRQALAEACAIEPHVVVGPVVDKLKRFYPLGWHALLGWNLYRTPAMWQLKSASSIAV